MSRTAARIMHVAAELEPIVKVGGLGEMLAGLEKALAGLGWVVEPVLPDYAGLPLADEESERLPVPSWAGPTFARRGHLDGVGVVTLIANEALRRPHPYADPFTGRAWADNDLRFFSFAAGAAALAALDAPDIVHVHDWHAAPTLCLSEPEIPRVLSIHNLAHQGITDHRWIDLIGDAGESMRIPGACDPLVGGIRCADAVVTVSPTYRTEICTTASEGLGEILTARHERLSGILNGIDTEVWDPGTDVRIPCAYDRSEPSGKHTCRAHLLRSTGHGARVGPVVAVTSRMAAQKGIDLAMGVIDLVARNDGLLMVHGAGEPEIVDLVHRVSSDHRDHVMVIDGWDETTAHRLLAGADLLLMPSRFEPCGLTQLQAMTYGTVPVVTDVGGLHDTVVDDDLHPGEGTGFVAPTATHDAVIDALHRALVARLDRTRWEAIQSRAMAADWGWLLPARSYDALYRALQPRHQPAEPAGVER